MTHEMRAQSRANETNRYSDSRFDNQTPFEWTKGWMNGIESHWMDNEWRRKLIKALITKYFDRFLYEFKRIITKKRREDEKN